RLLVHKRDKTQLVLYWLLGETARQCEHCSNAAAIVIGSGRTAHRILLRADEKNLGTSTNFRLDVVTGSSVQVVRVTPRMQTGTEKRIFDEIGGGIQLRIARHVSFTDFA